MTIDQKLNDAANLAAAAAPLLDEFANGDEDTVINGRGGDYPSQAGVAKKTRLEIIGNLQPTVTSINQHFVKTQAEAGKAKSEADRAKREADNAAAVVTGGTAELEPAPGKIPIADAHGHINAGWTPLLTAMHPYSGVIGSVDKGDMFFIAGAHADWVNKLRFRDVAFNINGKFVNKAREVITLPEAEDTAARAVSFDDIFLDWNGTVTSHRSITSHRTATGYDRDAIATEHGYSKVQTGLYKAGSTYSLLLGRVVRRNKGAYHPVFNPEGTLGHADDVVGDKGSNLSWYSASVKKPKNVTDCFLDWPVGVKTYADVNNGAIAGTDMRVLNPDKKFYDAIYSDDFTPLYYSAKNVIDRQALLFDSFNKAIAGETFSGAEGTQVMQLQTNTIQHGAGAAISGVNFFQLYQGRTTDWEVFRDACYLGKQVLLQVGSSFFSAIVSIIRDYEIYLGRATKLYGADLVVDGQYKPFKGNPSGGVFISQPSARPQFLAVDIIGSLDHMPDEWKTEGIPGNWLATGEEGEDLIPDGTAKNYKMSRKCLEAYQVLKTDDKGATWSDVTSTYKTDIEGTTNSMGSQSFAATDVFMVFYKTRANPFELANNSVVSCLSDTALAANTFYSRPSLLNSWLTGKIPTESTAIRYSTLTLKNAGVIDNNKLSSASHILPITHDPILLPLGSPFTKIGKYLTGNYMQCFYQEVRHNDTQWGDDSKFHIVDNQSTVTDLNGEDVIVGQKRVELPYQFDGVTY